MNNCVVLKGNTLIFASGTKIKYRTHETALSKIAEYQLQLVTTHKTINKSSTSKAERELYRAKKRLNLRTTRRGGVPIKGLDRKGR